MTKKSGKSFLEIIFKLQEYWAKYGCVIVQPYNLEVGAGTLHPATTLKSLGDAEWNTAYIQPSIRPADGRYGENPNRLYQHHQYQVLLKPSPDNLQELCLESLATIGLDPLKHDIRFVEDDWENPTIGAWGLGWELWCDGMEILQFTYFQQVGGIECKRVAGELTYGLERLIMYIQDVENVFDLDYNGAGVTYGDVFKEAERQFSTYALDEANVETLFQDFQDAEEQAMELVEKDLPLPAYNHCLNASHILNVLDARGVIGVTERANYIARVRNLAKAACEKWLEVAA